MASERGKPDPLIAKARKDWKKASEAEDPQRKSILAAKQFRAGNQWDAALKLQRQGSQAIAGVPAQPPRPCLVVDRLSQPVRQTSNTIKNASFGFDVLPNGAGADDETAEIYKGYMRRVHNNARGESPVEWAADGAIEGGLGWFRLRTEYVHANWDGEPTEDVFDQEVRLERITNSLSVYCDPSSLHPTRKDARFMFVTEDLDKDDEKYGTMNLRGLDEFMATGDMQGWVSQDTVRVAEYWRVEFSQRTFVHTVDGNFLEVTKETPKPPKAEVRRERVMRVPTIKCDIINAVESLKSYEWVGTRIPLFPILGEELNVDGKPVLRGIVQEGMDAQRMVNYSYSGAMELFALEPKSPWIAEWETIADFKGFWETANLYNYSYLPWSRKTPDSAPPVRTDRRGDGINAAVALMQVSEEAIKATTSTGDASLGNSHPNERSGRALQALQAASDLANSNYPDNVRRALIAAAEEMAIVIPKITRKGQIIQILGLDEEPKQVMVGQPFKEGKNGVPEAAGPEITPEIAKLEGSLHKFYDLNNGRYAVTVTVGKANATKREEGAAAIGELIPHLPPEMAAVATPEYVQQLSFPGAQKMAEKLRLTLPPHLQDQKDQGDIPPQVAAMVAQLQQQLQEATQALQTDQAKQQATIQSAQISAQADLQGAQLKAQTESQASEADAQRDLALQQQKLQAEMQMEEMKLRIQAETQMQVEHLKAELAIQLEQMKEQSAYDIATETARIKASAMKKITTSRDANGNMTAEVSGDVQ